MNKITLFILVILFPVHINAQNTDTINVKHLVLKSFRGYMSEKSPTILINYGFSKISLEDFNSDFAKPNLIELRIGFSQKNHVYKNSVYSYLMGDFLLGNTTTSISNASVLDGLRTNTWRFGFNRSLGYGYSFGIFGITLNNENSFLWSKVQFLDEPKDSIDRHVTDLFNNAFRFGTSTEASIQFNISSYAAVNAGYERAIVFRRHLLFKWALSEAVELGAGYALDEFINELQNRAPMIVPIINFVVKNALSYGIYQLRQKKMYWPLKSEPPLSFDQFKAGLVFSF